MAQGILANCDESDSDDKRLELTGDVCLLKVLTGLPPDRPGVYRLLKLGDTLASTEGGGYQLDLSKPGQHKTASVFGPACTTTPPSVAAAINALGFSNSPATVPVAIYGYVPGANAAPCLPNLSPNSRNGPPNTLSD